jgi:hypothetical protein
LKSSRVFVDTNVLFPASLADLTLSTAEYGLFELVYSDHLLDEIQRVLVDQKGLAPANAQRFIDEIRKTFPDGRIASATYQSTAESWTGPDRADLIRGCSLRRCSRRCRRFGVGPVPLAARSRRAQVRRLVDTSKTGNAFSPGRRVDVGGTAIYPVRMMVESLALAAASPGTACAYLSKVVDTRRWSRRRETTTMGTPAWSISVAMKWRRSCRRNWRGPAARRCRTKAW